MKRKIGKEPAEYRREQDKKRRKWRKWRKCINEQDDYQKNRNYWKYLKAKLRKEQSEGVSATTQLKQSLLVKIQFVSDTHDLKPLRTTRLTYVRSTI